MAIILICYNNKKKSSLKEPHINICDGAATLWLDADRAGVFTPEEMGVSVFDLISRWQYWYAVYILKKNKTLRDYFIYMWLWDCKRSHICCAKVTNKVKMIDLKFNKLCSWAPVTDTTL